MLTVLTLTVADLLALPIMQSARPVVATGELDAELAQRPVRWVHTSEIYDIAPLLHGGEVLLTTGLGLVAANASARRAYIRGLAERDVAALVLEVGRTFPEVPTDLVDAARQVSLPLIVLNTVVPFIDITEAAHTLILNSELVALRRATHVDDALAIALADGADAEGVLTLLASFTACPTALLTTKDAVVATSADISRTQAEQAALPDSTPASFRTDLVVTGRVVGRLMVLGEPTLERRAVAQRAVPFLAAAVRGGVSTDSIQLVGGDLLSDIAAGRYATIAELDQRARELGLAPDPTHRLIATVIELAGAVLGNDPISDAIAAREAAFATLGVAVSAVVGNRIHLVCVTPAGASRPRLEQFAARFETYLTQSRRRVFTAAVAPPIAKIAGLPDALAAAGATLDLARRLTPTAQLVLTEDFSLYQLLATVVDDGALVGFVNGQLGALLEYDAQHGSHLVRTLDVYLGEGLSKSATATRLGVRRQTLYSRLDRISNILGGADLGNRERRTSLDLALVAWRLRSAGATAR